VRILLKKRWFEVEVEPEDDGRWVCEILDLPGCLVYGPSREVAIKLAEELALYILEEEAG
jgi:predicted RNase H-like HicB family nuclease